MPHDSADSMLVGYNEAARLLSISRPHLERMVRSGSIPFIRLGRSVRFRRQALEDWLKAQERGSLAGTGTTVPQAE